MDLNKFGKRAYNNALSRGKIHNDLADIYVVHEETVVSMTEEMNEVVVASETLPGDHLPQYTEIVEELVDVAIAAITELHRRGVDIEEVLHAKMKYNESRT